MKLLGKLLLLAVLVWAINQVVFRALKLPLLWGVYYEKQAYYETNADSINTVFLGSSLTHRQINSTLFDSLNKAQGNASSSYNYGYDASTLPEVFTTYKHVLNNKNPALKTVIVEMAPPRNFDMVQLHSLRRKSFDNFGQSFHSARVSLGTTATLTEKLSFLWFNTVNLIEAEFNVGMLQDAYKFKQHQNHYKVPHQRNDMDPLEAEGDSLKEVEYLGKKYKNPHIAFLQTGIPAFEDNTQKLRTLFSNTGAYKNAERNAGYEALISKMMELAKQKNIRLIFLLPPRLDEVDYTDVMPVYLSLPAANRIELADPHKYPEFYTIDASYDKGHLLKPAADVYTTRLQQRYLELQQP